MPNTKSQFLRYLCIDKVLRTRYHKIDVEFLIQEIYKSTGEEVKKRTVQQDLKDMRDMFGAPISSSPYKYENEDYFFMQEEAFRHELGKYVQALSVLSPFDGFNVISQLIEELRAVVGDDEHLNRALPDNLIQLDSMHIQRGMEFLNPLFDACYNHLEVNLKHISYNTCLLYTSDAADE